jgi:hypothetical protein
MGGPAFGGQPTLEIRIGDVAATVDEAVLVAAALDDLRRIGSGLAGSARRTDAAADWVT